MVSRQKRLEQDVARKEVRELFSLAAKAPQEWADRYVQKARKIASRNRVSLREHNRKHCRKCAAYFSAKTLRVRLRPSGVVYTCLRCGHMTRVRKDGKGKASKQ